VARQAHPAGDYAIRDQTSLIYRPDDQDRPLYNEFSSGIKTNLLADDVARLAMLAKIFPRIPSSRVIDYTMMQMVLLWWMDWRQLFCALSR